MSPEFDHIILSLNSLGRGTRDTLEDLAHITQVVSVMRLGWGRAETLLDHLVDDNGI